MDFDDRLGMFLLGCLIGSVVGYIVRLLQETREKIDRVDKTVKDAHRAPRDEKGFMRYRFVADIMMILVLMVTVYAAFSTQKVNNDLKKTQADLAVAQDRIEHVAGCTALTLTEAIDALNGRTTYTVEQVDSNVELQRAQADMLRILAHEPPYSEVEQEKAIQAYFSALDKFVGLSEKTKDKAEQNDYPTTSEFKACLNDKVMEVP